MGVVTSSPFPEAFQRLLKEMSRSNQTSEDEDDSEDESEDDEGRSCCCQGLIQQRKRKVCFEDLEYSNEADFPKKGICFFFEKISDVEKINAEMKQIKNISFS
ncbi:hypothetical protein DY000_02037314 [Brassica cretica]|uniref:Uncharacterized protein n=1 Tax=Brassica cretica TaxID=69181 RepID=A0ABQ7BGA9_BRACR|nr:hypothetical protein DY000_02037314 [Brassica cretica]